LSELVRDTFRSQSRQTTVGRVLVHDQEGADMKRIVRRAGERLVGLVLPKVEAGACVELSGKCCPSRNYRYNCYGTCKFDIVC
jgi:hypothetical protein